MEKKLVKQRRKPKQERALKKYNALLDAVSRILSRQGYAKTSITELSHESDLPYATIYQYFENKDDIMVAWIERLLDQIYYQLLESHSQQKRENIEAEIEVLVNSALTIISLNKGSMKEMFSGMPQILSSRLLKIMEDKTVQLVNELFFQEIEALEHPDLDYSLRFLTKMIIGLLLQSILHDSDSLDIAKESKEISFVVNLYTKEKGMLAV